MTDKTEIALIEDIAQDKWPELYRTGGLTPYLDSVREQVSGEVPDLTTDKGRKRIASLAAQVSRSKTAIEKPGREYLKQIKELPKQVEAELREFTRAMDALRDEVRQPLTEFEEKEKARVAALQDRLQGVVDFGVLPDYERPSKDIADSIENLTAVVIDETWQEFESEAHRAKAKSMESLQAQLAKQQQIEAERAELEALRIAQQEQQRKDEIAAAEKAAAERARQQAIEEAEAKERAAKAEQERIAREHQLAIERAGREKAEMEAAALREKEQAEARQRAAVEAERQRLEAEKAAEIAEQQRREKDKAHKTKINREALADLVNIGLTDDQAKAVITAIAKGAVSHIKIMY